jgi:hypothetical protein
VRVSVFMIFKWGCGLVVGRPWCELQMAGEWALRICGAELWRRWLEVVWR